MESPSCSKWVQVSSAVVMLRLLSSWDQCSGRDEGTDVRTLLVCFPGVRYARVAGLLARSLREPSQSPSIAAAWSSPPHQAPVDRRRGRCEESPGRVPSPVLLPLLVAASGRLLAAPTALAGCVSLRHGS